MGGEGGAVTKVIALALVVAFILITIFYMAGGVKTFMNDRDIVSKEQVSASVIDKKSVVTHSGRYTVTKYYVYVEYAEANLGIESRALYDSVVKGDLVDVMFVKHEDGRTELQVR